MGLRCRTFTDEQFIEAVRESYSIAEVLKKLYLKPAGANYRMFKIISKKLNTDNSHFKGRGYLKGKTHNWSQKIPLPQILIQDSSYSTTSRLNKRLIKEGYLKDKCSVCHITEWQGQKLSLHLDHINGINTDHRIENLRLLCPNCHSQTSTYCGKNKKRSPNIKTIKPSKLPKPPNLCAGCNKEIDHKSKLCRRCNGKKSTKTQWPTDKELVKLIWNIPRTQLAKQFGVSDSAISKRCKLRGINQPPRGYWAKKIAGKV